MRSALLALSLSLAFPAYAQGQASPGPDAQSAALRRTLASVVVLKKLDLSPEQKRALQGVIGEVKELRSKVASDPTLETLRGQRQALLEKAIAEARANGSASAETRASLMGMRESTRERGLAFRPERKQLVQRLKAIFTPEQVEALQSLKSELGGERETRGGEEERPPRKGAGKMFLLRLLMSDEFATELAR